MSVVTAVAALAAIGLLFAMDPGGAIAESGFPDFREMDWKQLAVWGFRTIGVVVAQLLIIVLWLWPKYRPPQALEEHRRPWSAGAPQSGSMPAAAVSALEGHMIWSPTLLASIIEMCQRGTLRIEAVGTRVGFLYRLSRQAPVQYDWERTICESMPSRATTVDALHEAIKKREDAIGDQIGDYLQHRGLFHDNPVRVRRENDDDAIGWGMLAGALMGVGSGLWAAVWLDQWWANALIGAFTGLVYLMMAPSIPTGMVPTTQRGAHEKSQWLGWQETMAGPAPPDARNKADSILPYAVALNVAQPWLNVSDSAPPWFGSDSASSLQGADLDAAYHGFMHSVEWYLSGRSDKAADAASWLKESEQIELGLWNTEQAEGTAKSEGGVGTAYERPQTEGVTPETEARGETAADPPSSPQDYRNYRPPGWVEEPKGGREWSGCFMWVVRLLGIGALVLAVLVGLNLVSPAVDPCPADSPTIPPPGPLGVALDVFLDECVSVAGDVVSRDIGELVVEIDRGEYVQRVRVRGPADAFEQVSVGERVHVAGRIGEHEDGGYVVRYGVDRGWWGNLRENLPGDVLTP
jgi:hypothetical protein